MKHRQFWIGFSAGAVTAALLVSTGFGLWFDMSAACWPGPVFDLACYGTFLERYQSLMGSAVAVIAAFIAIGPALQQLRQLKAQNDIATYSTFRGDIARISDIQEYISRYSQNYSFNSVYNDFRNAPDGKDCARHYNALLIVVDEWRGVAARLRDLAHEYGASPSEIDLLTKLRGEIVGFCNLLVSATNEMQQIMYGSKDDYHIHKTIAIEALSSAGTANQIFFSRIGHLNDLINGMKARNVRAASEALQRARKSGSGTSDAQI